jgi:hypothetical protein
MANGGRAPADRDEECAPSAAARPNRAFDFPGLGYGQKARRATRPVAAVRSQPEIVDEVPGIPSGTRTYRPEKAKTGVGGSGALVDPLPVGPAHQPLSRERLSKLAWNGTLDAGT